MTGRHIVAAESRAAGRFNEDRVGVAGDYFWVLDGATPLLPARTFPGDSDAAWFAQSWSAALAELARDFNSPLALIEAAFGRVTERIAAEAVVPLEQHLYPALALALVRVGDGRLDACNVGDCSIVVRPDGRAAERIGSSDVDGFDALALGVFTDALESGRSYAEALDLARNQILCNRMRANCSGGYWVVDPSPRWLDHIQCFSIPFAFGGDVLVASDGFMRILDPYRIASSLDEILELVLNPGLRALLDRMRALEEDDCECRSFPRLKPIDDASAILAHFHRA
jgi:Protein phosphatase 2C